MKAIPCKWCGAMPEVKQQVAIVNGGTRYYANATCPNCDVLVRGQTILEATYEWNKKMSKEIKHG